MNIFYEKPKDYDSVWYGVKEDINGKPIWINWNAWIHSINIDCPENLKLLPPEISKYLDKWNQELLKKKEEGFCAPYEWDLNPPTIYFIYDDNVYTILPEAFKTNYHYFFGIRNIIKADLVEAGAIFTWYID